MSKFYCLNNHKITGRIYPKIFYDKNGSMLCVCKSQFITQKKIFKNEENKKLIRNNTFQNLTKLINNDSFDNISNKLLFTKKLSKDISKDNSKDNINDECEELFF